MVKALEFFNGELTLASTFKGTNNHNSGISPSYTISNPQPGVNVCMYVCVCVCVCKQYGCQRANKGVLYMTEGWLRTQGVL